MTAIATTIDSALVVDDDPDMCRVLEITLASVGCAAMAVGSGRCAIALLRQRAFPVAFVDARLPDIDGWRLVEEFRRVRAQMRIVMISGYYFEDDARVADALRAGSVEAFLAKPFRIEAILAALGSGEGGKGRRSVAGGAARPAGPSLDDGSRRQPASG